MMARLKTWVPLVIIPDQLFDDWFSALLILASEKDILKELSIDVIIDRCANCSDL